MNIQAVISVYFQEFIDIMSARVYGQGAAVNVRLFYYDQISDKPQKMDVCLLFGNKKIIILRKNPAGK
jgi:hypothetical protein